METNDVYNINIYNKKVHNTNQCIDLLNEYKEGDWKRVIKFNLNNGDKSIVRVFRDDNDNEHVTVIFSGYFETHLCKNIDLSKYRDLFKKLDNINKKYYTVDYGEVLFNPYTNNIHLSISDGGAFKSDEPKSEIIRKLENEEMEFDDYCSISSNIDDYASDINEVRNVEINHEWSPPIEEPDNLSNWIHISNITVIEF